MKTFKEHWACPNGCLQPVEWVEEKRRNSIFNRFLLKTSFHALFTFIYFCYLFGSLSPAASSVSWYWSYLVYSELAYEIYSGGGPSAYVYCLVCYRVIVAPNVWSVGHVFTYLYTLDDNLESHSLWTMRLFLLPKVFPLVVIFHDQHINCHQWCITWFYI